MVILIEWSVLEQKAKLNHIKILEFNQYQKSDKSTISYLCRSWMFNKKNDGCKKNPENSSTTKVGEHVPSVCAMLTHLKA